MQGLSVEGDREQGLDQEAGVEGRRADQTSRDRVGVVDVLQHDVAAARENGRVRRHEAVVAQAAPLHDVTRGDELRWMRKARIAAVEIAGDAERADAGYGCGNRD